MQTVFSKAGVKGVLAIALIAITAWAFVSQRPAEASIAPQSAPDFGVFVWYEGVDGDIEEGEYEGWSKVGCCNGWVSGAAEKEAGKSAGVEAGDLLIVHDYDMSGPVLLEKCLTGEVIPYVQLEHVFYGQMKLRHELTNALATECGYGGGGAEGVPGQLPIIFFKFSYDELVVTYFDYDGEELVGESQMTYEVPKAK